MSSYYLLTIMPILDTLPSQAAISFFVGSAILLLTLNTYLKYRRAVGSIQNHPGLLFLFDLHGLVANILPHIPGVAVGQHWGMRFKHKFFAERGWDVLSTVGIFPRISIGYLIADPLAIKEITINRSRFPKALEAYEALSFFGKNIVITEGDEWRKHRKISAPVFSEKNYKLVWDESVRIMLETFANWGPNNSEVVVDHAVDITVLVALMIISVAGFGRRISWDDDKLIPAGHKLSFHEAVHTVSTRLQLKVIAPKWMYPFSKTLRHVQAAFDELEMYMQEMIDARRTSVVKEERYDLFSALLDASEQDKEGFALTDREVSGNIFIFLIAGHETTAHTVCFSMGLLALEQEEQEKMYQQILSVLPNGEIPNYEQMNALTYPLAVFYETLRLYPPVLYIPKTCAEDTTIPAVRPDGTKGVLHFPKGARIQLNTSGLHFNPRYWPDPETFKPSRFFGDWPKDAFLPFSGGPRACIGRKFSETEAVAILTMLVSRYKIEIRDPHLYEGLTHAEKRAKLLANHPAVTTTPDCVPLVFRKR